jgi:hypothetical protein
MSGLLSVFHNDSPDPGVTDINTRRVQKVLMVSQEVRPGRPCAGPERPAHDSLQRADSPAGFSESWRAASARQL